MADTKSPKNNQFARTSTPLFARSVPQSGPDLGIEPLADVDGRLIVRVFGDTPPNPFPNTFNSSISAVGPLWQPSGAIGPTRLENLYGYCADMTTIPFWFQMFDTAIVLPLQPATIIIPLTDNFIIFSWAIPFIFTLGLFVGVSTNELLYVPDPASRMSLAARYSIP